MESLVDVKSGDEKSAWIHEHFLDLKDKLRDDLKLVFRNATGPFELIFRRGYQAGWEDAKSGMKKKRIG